MSEERRALNKPDSKPSKKGDEGSTSSVPPLLLEPGLEAVPGYQLAELIGEGGFGQVWKAHGPGGFLVAIKFVRLGNKAEVVEMRSLELMKNIRHANLVTVFGTWQDHGYLIIAMELADRTLLDYYHELTSQGLPGIPIPELFDYMLEAAKGIDHLNSLGIQHRDIKPHNLFLVGGSVKVADFGLAQVVETKPARHTGTGMTPAYAAPEFFAGKTTAQSDQYSLAVTYCHLRNGRLPFEGSAAQIMAGHFFERPNLSMLPAEERPVVAQALAKKPEERWPTCRAFVQALVEASAVGHGSYRAPPVRSAAKAERVPTRRESPQGQPRRGAAGTAVRGSGSGEPRPAPRPAGGAPSPVGYGDTAPANNSPVTKPKSQPAPGAGKGPTPASGAAGEGARQAGVGRKSGPRPQQKSRRLALALGIGVTAGIAAVALMIWQPWQGAVAVRSDSSANSAPSGNAGAAAAEFVQSFRHSLGALGVAYFPDGSRVVSAGKDNCLRIWEVATGAELHVLRGHMAAVTSVSVSADGHHILSGSDDRTVRLWNADSGVELRALRGHTDAVTCVALSAKSQRAASASRDKTVRVWDVERDTSSKPVELRHTEWVYAVAISADGKRVLSGGVDHLVRLWDTDRSEVVRTYDGNADFVRSVAFSRDGKRVISGGADKTVRVWKESGESVKVLVGHQERVNSVAATLDGLRILSGSDDHTVRFWDTESGRECAPTKSYADRITSVALSADGHRAVCGSEDGEIRMWGLVK